MNELRFEDTGLDESPPTIAYVLLALTSMAFDYEIAIMDAYDGEVIIIRDENTGFEYVRVRVSHMMGTLLRAILEQTSREMAGVSSGEEPWISNQS